MPTWYTGDYPVGEKGSWNSESANSINTGRCVPSSSWQAKRGILAARACACVCSVTTACIRGHVWLHTRHQTPVSCPHRLQSRFQGPFNSTAAMIKPSQPIKSRPETAAAVSVGVLCRPKLARALRSAALVRGTTEDLSYVLITDDFAFVESAGDDHVFAWQMALPGGKCRSFALPILKCGYAHAGFSLARLCPPGPHHGALGCTRLYN